MVQLLLRRGNITRTFFSYHKFSSVPQRQRSSWEEIYTTDPVDPSESKFNKILIANRGEIACRIIHTCRRMGIKTVAVHSDVDSRSLFVKLADEAFCIGPAPTNQSYLNIDAIVDVIKKSEAEAVHPGYGFLSENTLFAARLEQEGVAWIGPNAKAIESMGDKIMSKKLANAAKVHCIPGFDGVIQNEEEAVRIAREIGYPVMIKASAGGGGKGMRIAWDDKEAANGFKLSSGEAKAFFGDDRLLIEKFIQKPRHIEMQFLCDKHGNGVHLNERECSIQRRNQKVIEEAPSTFVTPEIRKAMGEQALQLAKAVGYDSAGTCEFLVDHERNFYFLEMNTRLQVEHPISECITGLDLVQQMIRVAKGHPLRVKQSDIPIRGWAFESRVYAEDPTKNFGLPSIGRLHRYQEPKYLERVRCDSGIVEGSEISIYYDPMICKLVTYGDTREEARKTMLNALDHYVIRGVTHNISLLRAVMNERKFVEGDIDTSYLKKTWPDGFPGITLTREQQEHLAVLAAAVYVQDEMTATRFLNDSAHLDRRHTLDTVWKLEVEFKGQKQRLEIDTKKGVGNYTAIIGDRTMNVQLPSNLSELILECEVDGKAYTTQLPWRNMAGGVRIRFLGTAFELSVMTHGAADYLSRMPPKPKKDFSKLIVAPMPGLVKTVAVKEGDQTGENQEVCVVEAMKMQNSLVASNAGKVKKVNVKPGQTVDEGDILVEFE